MNKLEKAIHIKKLNKKKTKTKKKKRKSNKKKKRSIPRKLFKPIMTDSEISNKEGNYFDESHYHTIVNTDFDAYGLNEKGEKILLFKLRKKCLSREFCDEAVESFREASKKKHENRGASAGLLDRNKLRGYVGEFINKGKFRTGYISNVSKIKSKQLVSNLAPSNIAGFYDRPDRNLKGKGAPCRLTAFNRDYVEKWNNAIPFIKNVDKVFKSLVPKRHKKQVERALQTPDYQIANTCFSTITLNYSWRTALHRDAGDYRKGFGNLVVLEDSKNPNEWGGCYFGLPQYGICAEVRHGDFLAANVHQWHCNTEFKAVDQKSPDEIVEKNKQFYYENNIKFTKSSEKKLRNNIKNDWHYNRLSMVFYLRENMLRCKDLDNTKNKTQEQILKTKKSLVVDVKQKQEIEHYTTSSVSDYSDSGEESESFDKDLEKEMNSSENTIINPEVLDITINKSETSKSETINNHDSDSDISLDLDNMNLSKIDRDEIELFLQDLEKSEESKSSSSDSY